MLKVGEQLDLTVFIPVAHAIWNQTQHRMFTLSHFGCIFIAALRHMQIVIYTL